MIIRTSPFKGAKARYKRVPGPEGERIAKFRAERAQRHAERFAVNGSAEDRRIMRNARKQERQER